MSAVAGWPGAAPAKGGFSYRDDTHTHRHVHTTHTHTLTKRGLADTRVLQQVHSVSVCDTNTAYVQQCALPRQTTACKQSKHWLTAITRPLAALPLGAGRSHVGTRMQRNRHEVKSTPEENFSQRLESRQAPTQHTHAHTDTRTHATPLGGARLEGLGTPPCNALKAPHQSTQEAQQRVCPLPLPMPPTYPPRATDSKQEPGCSRRRHALWPQCLFGQGCWPASPASHTTATGKTLARTGTNQDGYEQNRSCGHCTPDNQRARADGQQAPGATTHTPAMHRPARTTNQADHSCGRCGCTPHQHHSGLLTAPPPSRHSQNRSTPYW